MVERKPRPAGETELALVAQMQRRGGEPTVAEYLAAANKNSPLLEQMRKDQKQPRLSRRAQKLEREAKLGFNSTLQNNQRSGKPPASEWKVQTGGGGAFVLQHRASGDYYADYVTAPQTSWGAKRFLTVKDAYEYLNNPKHFSQGRGPQGSWNQTKNRGDKVQERVRKQMGFA